MYAPIPDEPSLVLTKPARILQNLKALGPKNCDVEASDRLQAWHSCALSLPSPDLVRVVLTQAGALLVRAELAWQLWDPIPLPWSTWCSWRFKSLGWL